MSDGSQVDKLFQAYREACPEVEPSTNFMPSLWQKIEARHSFWFVFQNLARTAMAASVALCLLLAGLNIFSTAQDNLKTAAPSYTDALMADHSAENTYYTEAIRNLAKGEEVPAEVSH